MDVSINLYLYMCIYLCIQASMYLNLYIKNMLGLRSSMDVSSRAIVTSVARL